MDDTIERVRGWIDDAKRVVVLTGAGISTESGIPDFRGPQGLWTRDPDAEKLSDIRYYMSDPAIRKKAWQARLVHPAWKARPNRGHDAIVALEQRGKLHALITQNIDGLHQKAGSSPGKVIEVHGTVLRVVCMRCGWRGATQETLTRLITGEDDPPCRLCGGILKSDTIVRTEPCPGSHRSRIGIRGGGRLPDRGRHELAGVSRRRCGAGGEGCRRARGDRQCRTDAVRRHRRCRAARAHWPDTAVDLPLCGVILPESVELRMRRVACMARVQSGANRFSRADGISQ